MDLRLIRELAHLAGVEGRDCLSRGERERGIALRDHRERLLDAYYAGEVPTDDEMFPFYSDEDANEQTREVA